MAKEGLWTLVTACALLGPVVAELSAASPPEERDNAVAAALAVQTAMQQGKDFLLHNNAKAAVEVLESQLASINGNPAYLTLLRDAYRAYVKELRFANQEAAAQLYIKRLAILDPGSAALAPKPTYVRGKIETNEPEDPFRPTPTEIGKREKEGFRGVQDLLARAELEFSNRKFGVASQLFEQAHQADPKATTASHERWAYCKLYQVVEQLNQPPQGGLAYADLEKEVRVALEMAPRLDYGKNLLSEIDKRRSGRAPAAPGKSEAAEPAVSIRHAERNADGYAVAESANFRIFHNQSRELAEQAVRICERTRADMHRKWFGGAPETWNPRCDVYLHATAQEYSRVTGVPTNSPGHSSIRQDGGRVIGRRIDLHCDIANMQAAVLPHETTHVVLAGNFGDFPVPRWCDEGIAVLSEPREKIDQHLHNLSRCQQDKQLFELGQLMRMNDYPDGRYIGPFYAQSVSLCDYLSHEKSPQVFTQFVRDGLRCGYEVALQRHYGIRSFTELEQRWRSYAFRGDVNSPATGVVQGYR